MKASKSAVFALLLALVASASRAEVPSSINFQGRLTDSAGNSLNGTQSIVFSAWDAVSGGSQLWSETQSVTLSSGIYNVSLGSITALSTAVFATPNAWLQIKVGADAAMTPRVKFQSVPYAFTAQLASSILSVLPVDDLFNLTPVNQDVAAATPYTVPAGKNLLIYNISPRTPGCFTEFSFGSSRAVGGCFVSVTGNHTATTVARVYGQTKQGNPAILGPGDVIASTATTLAATIRAVLVPAVVTVILQDLGIGGSYTVPAGKTLYFGTIAAAYQCSGTMNIGGFVSATNAGQGGILNAGQSLTNNTNCVMTLNGYLR